MHGVKAGSAEEYLEVEVAGLDVTVTDNDTTGVSVSKSTLSIAEGGADTYTVVLDTKPTHGVTITVSAGTGVTTDKSTLSFTPDDWSTAQTVTVTGSQDADAGDVTATISHSSTSTDSDYHNATIASVEVTVDDDETAAVTISRETLIVDEGGTGEYTVVLAVPPTAEVVVNVSPDTGVTTNKSELTFTTTNWSMPQTVTVTGSEDFDASDESVEIQHTIKTGSAGEYLDQDLTIDDVAVTVHDNDTAGLNISKSSLTVNEGSTGDFTVKLNTLPSAGVTISLSAGSGITIDESSLGFTTNDWNVAQTVTVTGSDDPDAADAMAGITMSTMSADPDYDELSHTVQVTVDDDETADVTVSKSSLTVNEGGAETYTVKLDVQPTSFVQITIIPLIGGITVSPGFLNFSTTNWSMPQTVTVTGTQDANAADATIEITHEFSGNSAAEYVNVDIDGVEVTVDDDEVAEVTVDPTEQEVQEGEGYSYTLVLTAEPTAIVKVETRRINVLVLLTTTEFTPTNWSTPQPLNFSAADEDANITNLTFALTHSVTNDSAAEYVGVSIDDAEITVIDDDNEVSVSAGAGVDEGDTATFTLTRAGNTHLELEVDVSVAASGGAAIDGTAPTTVTFAEDEATATLEVTAADDKVIGAGGGQIAVTIGEGADPTQGAGYVIKSGEGTATVTVSDDDKHSDAEWGLTLSKTTIIEGQAGADISVSITNGYTFSADETLIVFWGGSALVGQRGLGLSGARDFSTLTLPAGDSSVSATLAAYDDERRNKWVTNDHGTSEAKLEIRLGGTKVAEADVTVVDDEPVPTVTIHARSTVEEGDDFTVEVRLAPAAEYPVRVSISHTDADSALSGTVPSSYDFSAIHTQYRFRVSTVEDVIDADENRRVTFQLTGTVAGHGTTLNNFGSAVSLGSARSVTVTILDDDRVPARPVGLSATDVDSFGQSTLSWTAGDVGALNGDASAVTVSKYQYRVSSDGRDTWSPNWDDLPGGAGATSADLPGLSFSLNYILQVRAVSNVGNGYPAEFLLAQSSVEIPDAAPLKRSLYQHYADGVWNMYLHWQAPRYVSFAGLNNDGRPWYSGHGFSGFQVEVRARPHGGSWDSWSQIYNGHGIDDRSTGIVDNPLEDYLGWARLDLGSRPECDAHQWRVRALYHNRETLAHSQWVSRSFDPAPKGRTPPKPRNYLPTHEERQNLIGSYMLKDGNNYIIHYEWHSAGTWSYPVTFAVYASHITTDQAIWWWWFR